MRIVHVIASLDPDLGGPPAVSMRLAAAQAAMGHSVAIVCYRVEGAEERTRKAIAKVPGAGALELVEMPPADRAERLLARGAKPVLRKAAAEADVFHMHGVWEMLLLAASRAARERGVPYVVRPAGMLDPWCLAQRPLKKKIALAMGYRRMLDGAAYIHALNADEKRLIEPLGIRATVEVIPNGVFLAEVEPLPARGTFRAKHPELGSAPFVLFLSRLHFKKGLDYLADAFALVAGRDTGVRLVVAGPDEGAKGDFEERIAKHERLAGRVHLVGGLYGQEKLAALADCACFCLPSRQEGFSVAIVEALACGVPCVVSKECHFPEVEESGAGFCTALEARAVAEALERVLADEGLRRRMSEAGRALVRGRYTWPRIAERTVEAYRSRAPAGAARAAS